MSSSVIKILNPESRFVIKWTRLMLIFRVISLIIDLLFLYVPHSKGPPCINFDFRAGLYISFFRTTLDVFHIVHMIFNFRMPFEGKGPKVFYRNRKFVEDPRLIAIKYLKSTFIIDLTAILPLPQIVIMRSKYTPVRVSIVMLEMIVALQITPRILVMALLHAKTLKSVGTVINKVWSGAIYNLIYFIMAGYFFGAGYYVIYLVRLQDCLVEVFNVHMYGPHATPSDCSHVHKVCVSKYTELEHGMLSDAFANEIGSRSFVQKLIYCFVWGVRCLSSLGQIFDASFSIVETTFSCTVMTIGLVLLADLIAQMQTSVQSAGQRREKQRIKQRTLEEWTHYHHLPHDLKRLVRQSVQSEWQCTKGIDDEAILNSLPLDLRRDIRTHLYQERVRNIPPFTRMDKQLVDFICGHLKPFTGEEGTYLVLQGDPLDKVVFIFSGTLQITHHSNGRANSRSLEAGDFFGDDLLTWASQPNSSTLDLPPSYFTVKCISNVEAFCLPAQDVRLLVVFNFIHKFQLALRKHHA